MSILNKAKRLTGLNPLSYLGVNASSPSQLVSYNIAPSITDWQNFNIGTIWIFTNVNVNPVTEQVYMLVSLAGNQAKWVEFTAGVGSVTTLTSNTGGAVPSLAGNINVIGDNVGITGVGDPATNTITFSLIGGGIAAQSFVTDLGTAVPTAAGVLNVLATPTAGSSVQFNGQTANTIKLNVTDANSNTLVGLNAGNSAITGNLNTGLGYNVGNALTSSSNNTFLGYTAGKLITSGNGHNLAVGSQAMVNATTASNNVAIGSNSLSNLLTGVDNTALGVNSGNNYTAAENINVIIGYQQLGVAGEIGVTRIGSVDSGNTGNVNNTFIGYNAGNNNYTLADATENTLVGSFSGHSVTTGGSNTLVGSAAGTRITTGSSNSAFGQNALAESFASGLTTGSSNCAFGANSLYSLATGSNNVVVGANSGVNYTGAETNNIIIGYSIGGTASESNTARIGNIYGVTTASGTTSTVLVSNGNQLGTISSSKRFKNNIKDMGDKSSPVMSLRPTTFHYNAHKDKILQFGLIAEEVNEIMPEIVNLDDEGLPFSVRYHDLPVILLNEIQKLNNRVKELEAKLQ